MTDLAVVESDRADSSSRASSRRIRVLRRDRAALPGPLRESAITSGESRNELSRSCTALTQSRSLRRETLRFPICLSCRIETALTVCGQCAHKRDSTRESSAPLRVSHRRLPLAIGQHEREHRPGSGFEQSPADGGHRPPRVDEIVDEQHRPRRHRALHLERATTLPYCRSCSAWSICGSVSRTLTTTSSQGSPSAVGEPLGEVGHQLGVAQARARRSPRSGDGSGFHRSANQRWPTRRRACRRTGRRACPSRTRLPQPPSPTDGERPADLHDRSVGDLGRGLDGSCLRGSIDPFGRPQVLDGALARCAGSRSEWRALGRCSCRTCRTARCRRRRGSRAGAACDTAGRRVRVVAHLLPARPGAAL